MSQTTHRWSHWGDGEVEAEQRNDNNINRGRQGTRVRQGEMLHFQEFCKTKKTHGLWWTLRKAFGYRRRWAVCKKTTSLSAIESESRLGKWILSSTWMTCKLWSDSIYDPKDNKYNYSNIRSKPGKLESKMFKDINLYLVPNSNFLYIQNHRKDHNWDNLCLWRRDTQPWQTWFTLSVPPVVIIYIPGYATKISWQYTVQQ